MRALVLGLILVNVLYWTWSSNVGTNSPAITLALDPDLPVLELVSRAPNTELDVSAIEPMLVSRVGSDGVMSVEDQNEETASAAIPDSTAANTPIVAGTETPATSPADQQADGEPAPALPAKPLVEQNVLAAVDPVANPARCVGVGPFVSLRQASEAAAVLNQAGLTTSQRVEESQVWVGHWVHLPSYPSREAAVLVVERLRKEGVKDIYIEPSGELKNTISLGLFTELERAEIRAGKVRKLGGVKPQIRNRSRDGLVYWIDVPLDAGIQLDTSGLPHNPSQELRVEAVDCPPVSARG